MADNNNSTNVGYGKPPKHTQFVKGQSGNPKGRPKGSQNPATILDKACRQRVRVTMNGKTKYITAFEASMMQLNNKAASGDLKAIRELFNWITSLPQFERAAVPAAIPNESDSLVMISITQRIRDSGEVPSDPESDLARKDTSTLEGHK